MSNCEVTKLPVLVRVAVLRSRLAIRDLEVDTQNGATFRKWSNTKHARFSVVSHTNEDGMQRLSPQA